MVKTRTQVQRSGFRDSARVKRLRQIGADMVQDSKATFWGGVVGCKIERPGGTTLALCGTSLRKLRIITQDFCTGRNRSNASTDEQIWKSGLTTLNLLNWHSFQFALDHHLFNHGLSPYDGTEAELNFPHHKHVKTPSFSAPRPFSPSQRT